MEYIVKWKQKNSSIEHFVAVRDYGAKLLAELLAENGYEYTIRPMPLPSKEYEAPKEKS